MDIGVWMSPETLREKLALRGDRNPEATWSLSRWPSGWREGEGLRLFVASKGAWRGCFEVAEALVNRADPAAAYTLLLDTRTWTPIPPVPARRFRGFTYEVPALAVDPSGRPAAREAPPARPEPASAR